MYLAASSMLVSARRKYADVERYFTAFDHLTDHFLHSHPKQLLNAISNNITHRSTTNHTHTTNNATQHDVWIVINSNKGLCGSFHAHINAFCEKHILLQQHRNNTISTTHNHTQQHDKPIVILIGDKSNALFGKEEVKHLIKLYQINSDNLTAKILNHSYASKITEQISAILEPFQIKQIRAVYNKFISTNKCTVTAADVFPIQASDTHNHGNNKNHPLFNYNKSLHSSIEYVAKKYFATKLHMMLLNSLMSEYGARMIAMDNAKRNSRDLLDDLNIIYNKTRQSNITKELIEIGAGIQTLHNNDDI